MEEEVEHHLCEVVEAVKKKMDGVSFPGESPRVVVWRTPFYETEVMYLLPFAMFDSELELLM